MAKCSRCGSPDETCPACDKRKAKHEPDSHAGYHKGNIEVFFVDDEEAKANLDLEQAGYGACSEPGWYWWSCCPGCIPDGEPSGPFDTSKEAYDDAFDGFYDATEGDEDGAAV